MTPKTMLGRPIHEYSQEDQVFFRWWYSHLRGDLIGEPLNRVGFGLARYIWNAAFRAARDGDA